MNRGLAIFLVAVAVIAAMSVFTVDERQRAILFQLGQIVESDFEPGLHFKLPLVQNVEKFDARIQNVDSDPQRYLTVEKKNVMVDSFVKWRIDKVERFYTSNAGSLRRASDRLTTIVQKLLKDEFGKRTVREVVSGERAQIMDILNRLAQAQAEDLGVTIVDVRIKRIDLPEEVSVSVYNRMEAERKEVAKAYRSRGQEQANVIRAEADRKRAVILAEARRDANIIRGEGDGTAAQIYADAYSQNPEFYSLYRSLDAYKRTFRDRSDILLLQPDAAFFKYFKNPMGEASEKAPMGAAAEKASVGVAAE